MQQTEWKLAPVAPTPEMVDAAFVGVVEDQDVLRQLARRRAMRKNYEAMLTAAPEPPHMSMTKDEAAVFQDWRGMDGACAFHLIERHANGWADTARMMEAWLAANVSPSNAEITAR